MLTDVRAARRAAKQALWLLALGFLMGLLVLLGLGAALDILGWVFG